MNPLLAEALGSILRKVLAAGAAWLVMQGYWTSDAAEQYVGAASLFLLSAGWGVWQQYRKRRKLVTAQAMPGPVTEREVEAAVKAGQAPPVTIPKDTAPVLSAP